MLCYTIRKNFAYGLIPCNIGKGCNGDSWLLVGDNPEIGSWVTLKPSAGCTGKDSDNALAGCETICAACQVASSLESELSVWRQESERSISGPNI